MIINQLLLDKLQSFDDSCHEFQLGLNDFVFEKTKGNSWMDEKNKLISDYRDKLDIFSSQIFVHQNLDKTDIVSVNFYEQFNTFFESDKYHISVEYYIQNGFGNKKVQITDVELLRKEFLIPYCLNSMWLVPMNIASNARKYSPDSCKVIVTLINEDTYKYITVVNYGPQCDESEINDLSEEYRRGNNSDFISGMGLGTSQVKSIIMLHKSLIDATYNFRSSKEVVFINGIPYSEFTTNISFSTVLQKKELDGFESIKSRIPLIIIHNMGEISANILFATEQLRYKYKGNRKWHKYIAKQILNVNDLQDTLRICLFIRNNFSTEYLFGNKCIVNIQKVIQDTIEVLCEERYRCKQISTAFSGEIGSIESYSILFSVLYGICNQICYMIPHNSSLLVEMETGWKNKTISIICEDVDFKHHWTYPKELCCKSMNDIPFLQRYFYKKILNDMGYQFDILRNKIMLNI